METQLAYPIILEEIKPPFSELQCERKEEVSNPNTKEVTVTSDNRYTTIEIDKSFKDSLLGKETNTHVKTSIIKDNILNTKQVHIRKIFSSLDLDKSDYIVRDIFIEHVNNKKYKTDKSIRVSLKNNDSLSSFLNLTKEKFILSLKNN